MTARAVGRDLRGERHGLSLRAPLRRVRLGRPGYHLDDTWPSHDGLAAHGAPHDVRSGSVQHGGEDAASGCAPVAHVSINIVRLHLLGEHHVLRAGRGDAEGLPALPRGGVAEPVPRLHANREGFAGDGGDDAGTRQLGPLELRDARRTRRLPGEDVDIERRAPDGVALVPAPHVKRVPASHLGLEANFARAVARLHRLDRHGPDPRGFHSEREHVRSGGDGVAEPVAALDADDAEGTRGELREALRVDDALRDVRRARRARTLERQSARLRREHQ